MKFFLLGLIFCSAQCLGQSLPNLEAQNVVTKEVQIVSWQDKKATVLVFLSSICPCSNAHIAYLKELAQKYTTINFVGIHSNADEDAKDSQNYFTQQDLPFPVLRDESSLWANRLKAYRTPHAFLISPQGEILYQGGVTSSADAKKADTFYLADTITNFLDGKKIETSKTRVLGCEIARK